MKTIHFYVSYLTRMLYWLNMQISKLSYEFTNFIPENLYNALCGSFCAGVSRAVGCIVCWVKHILVIFWVVWSKGIFHIGLLQHLGRLPTEKAGNCQAISQVWNGWRMFIPIGVGQENCGSLSLGGSKIEVLPNADVSDLAYELVQVSAQKASAS